jgi:DNA polymerase III epsilon subunit-like protein
MYTRRPAARDCDLMFFDVETGGLDPDRHDIIDIACVRTDPTGKTVLDEYSSRIIPVRPVDAAAARVNGYTAEKWAAGAVPLNTAMVHVLKVARDCLFTAHNVSFDWSFLEAAMKECQQRWPSTYHKIDTVALAMPMLRAGLVENVKLTTLTKFFGIEHTDAHSALSDARACREVFLRLDSVYGPAIKSLSSAP